MTSERIGEDMVVTLQYKLSLDDGDVVEFSEEADPLIYLHGYDAIIPGLENGLEGMAVGESKRISVEPEDGYGVYDAEEIEVIQRDEMPPDFNAEVGMLLEVHDEEGEAFLATITEVTPQAVTLDLNHPMAGKRLHFDVTITAVRAATPDELEHGHVHDGDHAH